MWAGKPVGSVEESAEQRRAAPGRTETLSVSIDYIFDDYLDDTGIARNAEVVPDHACQVFDGEVLESDDSFEESPKPAPSIERARDTVERMLSSDI